VTVNTMQWVQSLFEPAQVMAAGLRSLVPRLLGALLIVGIGWGLAHLCGRVVVRLLGALGLERLAEIAGISGALRRGAVRLTFVELLGRLGYWLVMIATLIVALQYLGATVATEWFAQFGAFVPRIVLSIAALVVGFLLAALLGATARAASLNAGVAQGHLVGQAVYALVVVLTIIIALEQLGVLTRTIEVTLYILLGACGLALALAFGLGAQGLARRLIEELFGDTPKSSGER